ncbi:MAG: aminoglycoside adenylyltransferase domain-containing protein [Planctomycetota bacterium]|jgi:hypothetical protein
MSLAEEVSAIGRAFAEGLGEILGEKLHGAYFYGAAVFPDTKTTGDIDFHVILEAELTEAERSALAGLHQRLGERFPPLGKDMDGYYLLLRDARQRERPQSQMWRRATDESWALHREHIHAGRCRVLAGPHPKTIVPAASWPEIESALLGELDYVEKHLTEYPGFSTLNLCRIIISFETRDVVLSKAQAARWALDHLPKWRKHVALAKKAYAREAKQEERTVILADMGRFFDFAKARIERARQETGK